MALRVGFRRARRGGGRGARTGVPWSELTIRDVLNWDDTAVYPGGGVPVRYRRSSPRLVVCMPAVPSRSPVASPTGQQWVIGHGHQQAVVTEVGATLRSYSVGGRRVIDGFGDDEWSESGRGQVLAPWPNRLSDGRYNFGGANIQAALDEPAGQRHPRTGPMAPLAAPRRTRRTWWR